MRRWILIFIFSLLFIVLSALFWLTLTKTGLSTTMTVVQKLVPALSIKKVSGRLYTGAEFEQIRYQLDQDSDLAIDNLSMSWQAMPLFFGRVVIDTLRATEVTITKKSLSAKTHDPIVLPAVVIPLPITVENVHINRVSYVDQNQPAVQIVSGIDAAFRLWGNNLKVQSLLLTLADDKSLKMNGSVKLTRQYDVDLTYEWQQLETLSASGMIKGNATQLHLLQQLQAPIVSEQKVTILDVLNTAKWQLHATLPNLIVGDFIADQTGQFNDVVISGQGDLKGASLSFNSQYQQDDLPCLVWEGTLDSVDFDNWSVSSNLNTDNGPSISAQGQIKTISTAPIVALSGQWQQLAWPLTPSQQSNVANRGDFTLSGDENNVAFTLDGNIDLYKKQLTIKGDGSTTPDQVTLADLKLAGLGGDATLKGWVNWQQADNRYQLDAKLQNITLPKALSERTIVINAGLLELAGTSVEAVVNLDGELSVNAVPTHLTFAADVTEQGAHNIRIDSEIGKAKISFAGTSSWQDQLAVLGKVEFEKLNPEILVPEWPGQLSGGWEMAVSNISNDNVDITLQDLNINGVLRARPLVVVADLSYLSQQLKLPKLDIRSGESTINVTGSMQEVLAINWQLTSPDLADLYPDLTGQLEASGTLEGNPLSPIIAATIFGRKIGYSNVMTLAELDSEFDVDLTPQGYFQGKATFTELTLNDSPAVSANVDLSGQKDNHQMDFSLLDKELTLSGHLSGKLTGEIWQGQFTRLQLDDTQAGRWALTKGGEITVGSNYAMLEEHCLTLDNGALCLEATYEPHDSWATQGQFTSVPVSLLQRFSTSLKSLQGNLNGQFELAGKTQYPLSGKGKVSLDQGRLFLADNDLIEENQINLSETYIDYHLTPTGGIANILITPDLSGVSPITGQVLLPNIKTVLEMPDKAALSGQFKMAVEDLAVFDTLRTEYENLQGKLKADIKLSGTAAKPDIVGHLTLDNGSVSVSSLGIVVSSIRAQAEGDLETGIKLNYQAKSGEGDFSGEGYIEFEDKGWLVSTTLKGSDVEMLNLLEAQVIVSPDLVFEMTSNAADVSGSVTIPKAALAPLQFSLPVTVSKDVVLINRRLEPETASLPTRVNVNVILGDKVEVKGLGFEGRLTGSLLVTGTTDKILLGTGELIIKEGSYIAYGQELVVDGGQILFSGGALDNPDLDIKAIREERDFTAGLQLIGPVDNPQILLFSTPTMSDDNVIAHLLLGRPFIETSASDAGMLAAAASGLGIKGGNMLGEKIASNFGLDTVAVNGDGENAALEIGKYLSPKLYLSYGVGIFESVNTINLRYKLNEIWSLEAESGEETGVDLLYIHER